jgi:hypothetical protein
MRTRLLLLGCLLSAGEATAGGTIVEKVHARLGLQRMPVCEYDSLFTQGKVGYIPSGKTDGTVLYAAQALFPLFRAKMQSIPWKGKHFVAEDLMINRWLLGLEAVSAPVHVGPSWYDGKPCIIVEYARNAAVFGNVRDELREIEPGVWLGRNYNRDGPVWKGYFIIRQ